MRKYLSDKIRSHICRSRTGANPVPPLPPQNRASRINYRDSLDGGFLILHYIFFLLFLATVLKTSDNNDKNNAKTSPSNNVGGIRGTPRN